MYTPRHVERYAAACYEEGQYVAADMLRAYAATLKAAQNTRVVSDDDVCDAMTVMFGNRWKPHTEEYARMRAALEAALSAEPAAQGDGDFKNFHRLLCERFGYVHDPVDWKRDQLSLIEHIAHTAPPAQPDSKVIGADSKVKPGERVPEGWVLVPREPTEVMAVAATKALTKFKPETVYGRPVMVTAREVYAAMLAATPAAPAEEGDGKEGVR